MQIFLNLLQIEFKLRLLAYKLGKLKKKVIIKNINCKINKDDTI